MSLIFANIIGYVVAHWRMFAVIGGIALLLLVVLIGARSCRKEPTVMSEQEKQEVMNAIADRDEKKLKEKLAEIEAKEQIIEGNVANADSTKINAIAESKKKWANANISDLQKEFDRRMQE